jgi:hypothetical protein
MVLSGWLTPSAALDITLCCEDDLKRARQCPGSGTAGRCCASFPLSMLPSLCLRMWGAARRCAPVSVTGAR